MDTNANGAIDFNEFIDMMVKRRDCLEDDVAHAFKADLLAMFDESLHLEAATTTGCPAKLFALGYLLFCRLLLMQISN